MAPGNPGHQPGKQRFEYARQYIDKSGFFRDAKEAQPQAQYTDQSNRDFNAESSHVESRLHDFAEDGGMAIDQPLIQGGYKANSKKAEPDVSQHLKQGTRGQGRGTRMMSHGSCLYRPAVIVIDAGVNNISEW
jgi:hypothetical protein